MSSTGGGWGFSMVVCANQQPASQAAVQISKCAVVAYQEYYYYYYYSMLALRLVHAKYCKVLYCALQNRFKLSSFGPCQVIWCSIVFYWQYKLPKCYYYILCYLWRVSQSVSGAPRKQIDATYRVVKPGGWSSSSRYASICTYIHSSLCSQFHHRSFGLSVVYRYVLLWPQYIPSTGIRTYT